MNLSKLFRLEQEGFFPRVSFLEAATTDMTYWFTSLTPIVITAEPAKETAP